MLLRLVARGAVIWVLLVCAAVLLTATTAAGASDAGSTRTTVDPTHEPICWKPTVCVPPEVSIDEIVADVMYRVCNPPPFVLC